MAREKLKPRGWLQMLVQYCTLDVRSLALLRVWLAVATCGYGVGHISAIAILGSNAPWAQGLLAVGITFLAVILTVGYHTRWTVMLCWVVLTALSSHDVPGYNPMALFRPGAELPALFFWAMFLPLGAAYSIDSALNPQTAAMRRIASSATVALAIQQCSITATAIAAASLILQSNLAVTEGGLSVLGLLGWLAFVPSFFWDEWQRQLSGLPQKGLAIYYDMDCGFCKKVVYLIRTFLCLPGTPLQPAQSEASIQADMEAWNSWVVVDWEGKRHFKFEAIAYVVSLSPLYRCFVPLLRWPPLMDAGTRFYEAIANNRRVAGRFTRPFKFRSFLIRTHPWQNVAVLGLLCLALVISFWR